MPRKSTRQSFSADSSSWLYQDHELNSPLSDEYHVSYFPFPIWRDAAMHDLIVRAALSAAEAVAQSGRSMRMGQHVLVRSDVVLTRLNGSVSHVTEAVSDAPENCCQFISR